MLLNINGLNNYAIGGIKPAYACCRCCHLHVRNYLASRLQHTENRPHTQTIGYMDSLTIYYKYTHTRTRCPPKKPDLVFCEWRRAPRRCRSCPGLDSRPPPPQTPPCPPDSWRTSWEIHESRYDDVCCLHWRFFAPRTRDADAERRSTYLLMPSRFFLWVTRFCRLSFSPADRPLLSLSISPPLPFLLPGPVYRAKNADSANIDHMMPHIGGVANLLQCIVRMRIETTLL